MRRLFSLFFPVMYLSTVWIAGSCSLLDKDDDPKKPLLTPSEVTLVEFEETAVAITEGKAPFQLSGGNAYTASVTVNGNAIDIKALKAGTSIVTVTGNDGGSTELVITVEPVGKIAPVLTPSVVEIQEGEVATVAISDGEAPYRLLGGNALVAAVTVNFNAITVKGVGAGDTYVQVTGADGASSILTIHVIEGLAQAEEDKYREFVTPELENSLKSKLGMTIHRGTNPPNVMGYFQMETNCTKSTIAGDGYLGQWIDNYRMKFYDQKGIEVSLEGFEVNYKPGYENNFIAQHDAIGTFICGSGNNFSVFFNETVQHTSGPNSTSFTAYSGELVKDGQGIVTGIRNFQFALLMRDNAGRSDLIDNGEGRLFEDDFVDVITKTQYENIIGKSSLKSAGVNNNLSSVFSK